MSSGPNLFEGKTMEVNKYWYLQMLTVNTHPCSSTGEPKLPSKGDIHRLWDGRVQTAYPVFVPFAYEISVPHSNSLGINLKAHTVQYPIGAAGKFLHCCAVTDASPPLNNVVMAGDILLKVNDKPLVSNDSTEQSFEASVKLIQTASTPRVIRFLRVGGHTYNLYPSPAEIILFANERDVTGSFQGVAVSQTPNVGTYTSSSTMAHAQYSSSSATNAVTASSINESKTAENTDKAKQTLQYSYQLRSPDSSTPSAVIKMLRHSKINWDNLSSSASLAPIHTESMTWQQEQDLLRGIPALGAGIYKEIYRDKYRYVTILHVKNNNSEKNDPNDKDVPAYPNPLYAKRRKVAHPHYHEGMRTYFLGKYDNYDEAVSRYKAAYQEFVNY